MFSSIYEYSVQNFFLIIIIYIGTVVTNGFEIDTSSSLGLGTRKPPVPRRHAHRIRPELVKYQTKTQKRCHIEKKNVSQYQLHIIDPLLMSISQVMFCRWLC